MAAVGGPGGPGGPAGPGSPGGPCELIFFFLLTQLSFITSTYYAYSKILLCALYNDTIPLARFLHRVHVFLEVPWAPAVQCILPFQEAQQVQEAPESHHNYDSLAFFLIIRSLIPK